MIVRPSRRRVFWSGGFDSTAWLLELLRRGDRVEAHYAPTGSDEWQKKHREMDARARILAALPAAWRSRLSIAESVPYDWALHAEMLKDWHEVDDQRKAGWWSSQGPLLSAVGRLVGGADALYIGTELIPEVADLFRRSGVRLPLLGVGKPAILDHAQRTGVDGLLALTWSCEGENDETIDRACGLCTPCQKRIIPATVRA